MNKQHFVGRTGLAAVIVFLMTWAGTAAAQCPVTATFDAVLCAGDTIDGYSTPGTYTDTFNIGVGCDSIRTWHLSGPYSGYGFYSVMPFTDDLFFYDPVADTLFKVADIGLVMDDQAGLQYHNGLLYIAEWKKDVMISYDIATGAIDTVFTLADIGPGMAINSAGTFYTHGEVPNVPAGSLRIIDLANGTNTMVGGVSSHISTLGIEFDANDMLWGCDEAAKGIGTYNLSTGDLTISSTTSSYNQLSGLTLDDNGLFWMFNMDSSNNTRGYVTYNLVNNTWAQPKKISTQLSGMAYGPAAGCFCPAVLGTVYQTICAGDSYEGYNISGTYTDTFALSACKDSLRVLHLTVLPPDASQQVKTICQGESYLGYSTTGIHIITYTNANNCDSTITLDLTVLDAPVITGFTSTDPACGLNNGVVAVEATGGVPPYVYSFDTGISFDTDSFQWGLPGGVFPVIVKDNNGCEAMATDTLAARPAVAINDTVIVYGTDVAQLEALAENSTFQWLLCDISGNTIIQDSTGSTIWGEGYHAYAVIITDTLTGCVDTSACYPVLATGIATTNNSLDLTLYPNPTTGAVTLQLSSFQPTKVSIINTLGQQVYQAEVTGTETLLDLQLQTGVYFVVVETEQGRGVKKLVVE